MKPHPVLSPHGRGFVPKWHSARIRAVGLNSSHKIEGKVLLPSCHSGLAGMEGVAVFWLSSSWTSAGAQPPLGARKVLCLIPVRIYFWIYLCFYQSCVHFAALLVLVALSCQLYRNISQLVTLYCLPGRQTSSLYLEGSSKETVLLLLSAILNGISRVPV